MGATSLGVGEDMVHAYRDLVAAEARLGEALARRGARLGSSVVDQWPVLHDYLNLYARGLAPAGMLVLGGRPDAGSRATGIPFTGAPEARRMLGLDAPGAVPSPSGAAFWRAVEKARGTLPHAPLEAFFATAHLAHAVPFDAPRGHEEVLDAAAGHVLRLLRGLRPQAVVAVGADALAVLARALPGVGLDALAREEGQVFSRRWPPGTPLHAYPSAETAPPRPFRLRVVPIPALDGPLARESSAALTPVLARAWA